MDNDLISELAEFSSVCIKAQDIFDQARRLYNMDDFEGHITIMMRDMLIEYSLLKTYSAWEKYLERTFILLMMGCRNPNGTPLNSYVRPKDEEHAYKLIVSTNQYPDWGDIDKIIKISSNFFEDGRPYAVLATMRRELNALKRIRNCMAHHSQKAKEDFENLVRGNIGYVPDNLTVVDFLIMNVPNMRPAVTFFQYYIEYLISIANLLVQH